MLGSIVCYFLLFSVTLAFNMTIYKSGDYNTGYKKPLHLVNDTYQFEFNMNEMLTVDLRLKNRAPDVVAMVYITYKMATKSDYMESKTMTKCSNEDCLVMRFGDSSKSNKYESIHVSIQLKNGATSELCDTQIILEGNATLPETTRKDVIDRSLCSQQRCIVAMDVQNVCQVPSTQVSDEDSQHSESASSSAQTSPNNIWIYVIPSVIVICVIILAIYISAKKFRRRNSDPAETMELKTYPNNEVLYADLSFMNGNSQPPSHVEESPYAEIIGVLKRT